ncbi:hypothetical protein LTR78_002664 [Recurvomyces mirabilis]|uniref:MYND-type domain-containing protein n=1 Tax=Recurvomyces mirabilis TaxID=574656 RepID=A0AAE0WU44_9PEZI|nr:hypothetical protein LTR78_002664 [Recurvomyces mirabilis]KAK5157593.1 hypothetical protein LTS14_004358 [Recurvomyces mirabilis]
MPHAGELPGLAVGQCAVCNASATDHNVMLRQCANCHNVQYCSRTCQRADWRQHKQVCGFTPSTFSGPASASSTTATARDARQSRPNITLLSLEKESFFDEMFSEVTSALRAGANVKEINTKDAARAMFSSQSKPDIILVTDAALTNKEFAPMLDMAVDYVHQGGTLIFMAHFPSFARPPRIKKLFQAFGSPWQSGDYHRTTHHLNNSMSRFDTSKLDSAYSQKALHLQNVERADAIYLPTASSHTESMVFPDTVGDRRQTPAAFGPCLRGMLGYLGDVNEEKGTDKVVLAMCGLA